MLADSAETVCSQEPILRHPFHLDKQFQLLGASEVHESWNDNIFIQEGEASFVLGGTATDAKEREPGEQRGSVIDGGTTTAMTVGDYLFIPAGVPHQMIVKPGQRVRFLAFKTHK